MLLIPIMQFCFIILGQMWALVGPLLSSHDEYMISNYSIKDLELITYHDLITWCAIWGICKSKILQIYDAWKEHGLEDLEMNYSLLFFLIFHVKAKVYYYIWGMECCWWWLNISINVAWAPTWRVVMPVRW
jgi:hypothetical protein